MTEITYSDRPRPKYDSEAERAGKKLVDNEARIANLERRPVGGGGAAGPWITPTLTSPWTGTLKYRWADASQSDIANSGLDWTGKITGPATAVDSPVLTLPTADRFAVEKGPMPIGIEDAAGNESVGTFKILTSGVVTISFPQT